MIAIGSQSVRELLDTARQLLEEERAFAAAEMVCGVIDALEDSAPRSIGGRMPPRRFGHAPIRLGTYRSCA